MRPRHSVALLLVGGLLLAVGHARGAAPGDAAAQATAFTADQLEQMVAPVALYPDPLLMQVLMASTYPLEVVEADRWRRSHADLKDDALDKALEERDWDPSVEGLTHFPDLLKRMSDNLDWTKDLGDAFLGQKDALLDAVQRMRARAQEAGTLESNKEQVVVKEKETIRIEPADPQVVYVPTYPPAAYGPTYAPAPYYPTAVYGYTGAQMATASLLSFGLGVGVGALVSDGCDWGGHDVYVNNNYYGGGGGGGGKNKGNTNVNINKDRTTNISNRQKWEHNSEHRRNVGYRDERTTQRYEGRDRAQARQREQRDSARGYDRGGGRERPAAGTQPRERPAGGQRPAGGGGGGRDARAAQARPAPSRATSGGRDSAFGGSGASGGGKAAHQASNRGAASRGGRSYAGGGGGGGGYGGGGGRGGGGGGRGGGGGGRGGGGGGRGGGGRGGGRR